MPEAKSTEKDKKVQKKRQPAPKPLQVESSPQATLGEQSGTLLELPDHPTTLRLRQAQILQMQRTHSNAYVQRYLAQQRGSGADRGNTTTASTAGAKDQAGSEGLEVDALDSQGAGMSDSLKSGLEELSGFDFSGVRVHHNSDKPIQLADRDSAVGSPSSGLIQRVPLVPAVAAAIKALSFIEAITAVGTVVSSAASIAGLVGAAQNDKSGVSPDAILTPTKGDYLMSDVDRDGLAQVLRVVYFAEVEKLVKAEVKSKTVLDDAKQEELKQTALGNVKFKLTRSMSKRLGPTTEAFVQQGDGGTSKETPWGEVTVSVEGGKYGDPSKSPAFVEIAKRHHVTVPERPLWFIKRVKLSFESEKDWNLTWNDDIWVRGTKLALTQGSDLHVGIEAEVAFDWDGDTSRYEWDKTNLITLDNIPKPNWRGPKDPDD